MKNGPNGINFCFLRYAHAAPNIHARTSAIANPVGPHHSPPTAINFISPIPIGESAFGLRCVMILSKINPTAVAIMYPNAMPTTPVWMPIGHGKNVVTIMPIIINGKRYPSGIIRRRISVADILYPRYNANNNKITKNNQNIYKNIFSSLRFESVL